MDFDTLPDLIDKSQIQFRRLAGLSSFNPNDTTLPPLPTVSSSISALDPSPSNLRCKFCKGKLLRDLQSLICIYCGEFQKNDVHPDPIAFNSTIGYSWLLQSLNFNGSERVGSLAEGVGINGSPSPAEDEATLSELLDLKITLRDQPKYSENLKSYEHNRSLNLDATDVDDFFVESKRDIHIGSDVREELQVANNSDQNKAFEAQENYNVLPSETSVTSPIDDASSDWNAEFQFADTKMEDEIPKSADHFVGSEADLSLQMDAVFGQEKSFNSKKVNDASDLFQDDLIANVSPDSVVKADARLLGHVNVNDPNLKDAYEDDDWSGVGNWQKSAANNSDVSQQAIQLDLFENVKDRSLHDNQNDSSTDWFDDTNWKKSGAENTDPMQADQLNLFDKVNDGSSQDNHMDSTTDWFGNSDWQKHGAENTVVDHLDLFDKINDGSLQDSQKDSSIDWFESSSFNKSTINNTVIVKNDNLFDSKPLFDPISSPSLVNDLMETEKSDLDNSDKQHSDATDWFQNSQWPVVASKDDDDDGFDEWNDFTSSTGNQDTQKQSSNVENAAGETKLESNLFPSTSDPQEVDFGNFLQSDPFSGSSSNKDSKDTHEVYDIYSQVSTTNRNANVDESKNDEITLNATTSRNNDVQMLLSQMHDLSFMLKSELSIPSKSDDRDPNSHS
ncbi:uncharacterized protein [Rutidosis leptorrhynchoides]|uniref:uncharacterized protein n=1 Tax=Rutidosis leptorrhynchoides TaxID=125765 RepID=UPI003A99F882